jgi:hypothetical protein
MAKTKSLTRYGLLGNKVEHRVLENEGENEKVIVGKKSAAMSSKQCLFYHDVPPELYRRIAQRHTGGHLKYIKEITMNLNWREGLDDPHYIMDRLNHMMQHMVDFLDTGNQNDDNLAAIAWSAGFLMEAERLNPELVMQVIGQSRFHGKSATQQKEFLRKAQK